MAKEKTRSICIKVSEKECECIDKMKDLAGIQNRSAYIRKMSINGYVIRLDTPIFDEIAKLLRITSNNVNQLAKHANSGSEIYRDDITEVNNQLEAIRINFGQALKQLDALE